MFALFLIFKLKFYKMNIFYLQVQVEKYLWTNMAQNYINLLKIQNNDGEKLDSAQTEDVT